MFLDNLRIIGKKKIKVPTITKKLFNKFSFKNRLLIRNAATAKAIPTP